MTTMRVADLKNPVTAMKVDWLVASSWIGFTPQGKGPDATAKCQATINAQMGSRYVVEYIAKGIDDPNAGYEADPQHLEERKLHAANAGKLIAVHRLRPSARPLREIVGHDGYERIQNMWSKNGDRRRWSVAFPIVESFTITDAPLATDVFFAEACQRLINHASATLRPLAQGDHAPLAGLQLVPRSAANAWIAIEDEIKAAEASDIPGDVAWDIGDDMPPTAAASAIEGMTEERWVKIRKRAAWLADRFVRERARAGTLHCDHCAFTPATSPRLAGVKVRPRSTLDVHHLHPLDEGKRRTTSSDFALLCPTCHRIEHLLLKAAKTAEK
jgi:5-methylcytosine-specific restriction protein A